MTAANAASAFSATFACVNIPLRVLALVADAQNMVKFRNFLAH